MMHSKILKLPNHSLVIVGLLAVLTSPATAVVIRNDSNYTQYDSYFLVSGGTGYRNVFDAVGKLTWSNYLCSGTAIAANWVLTAAHCLDNTALSANQYTFTLGNSTFSGAAKYVYDAWNPNNLVAGGDLALLKLDTSISILSYFPALWTTNNEVGNIGTVVGFGKTGNGNTGATGSAGVKHAAQNAIDAYGNGQDRYGNNFGLSPNILLTDFDSARQQTNRTGTTWLPYEGDSAPGDSGGALFIGNVLAGITSFGWGAYDGNPNSSYGDLSGYTRVSSFVDWIMQCTLTSGASCPTTATATLSTQTTTAPKSFITLQESVSVPEPTSTLGFLALGTLGAASTLKRKLKQYKSTEEDAIKVD